MSNVSCTVQLPTLTDSPVESGIRVVKKRRKVELDTSTALLKKEIDKSKAQNQLVAALKKTKVEQAETKILKNLPDIVQKVIDQALAGDNSAQKLLLDRVLPVMKATEGGEGNSKANGFNISINVSGNSEVKLAPQGEIIDSNGDIAEGEIIDG